MEWEFLPEAACIGFIRTSIKAKCRALSQAWLLKAGVLEKHGSDGASTLKVQNGVSTQKRAPHARRPSTTAPGVGGGA
jgi:hypothetical protein